MDAQTLGTSPPFPADFNHDEDQDFKTNSSKQNSNVIHNNSKQNDCGIEICPTSRRPSTIGSLGTVQGGGLPSARYLENEIVTKHLDSRKHLTANDVGLCELILLTSFNLSYGFICGTFALWILPSEARRLFPLFQSLTLGLSLGIVGVTQLVCPIAGKISDLHYSDTRLGKRRPFILWGCIAAIVSTLGMWQSSLHMLRYSYYFFLFLGMGSLNVVYAVNCGLVPDFLDQDTQGKSSGMVAVHTLLGSASGFALVMITADNDFHYVYPIYIVLVGITCWMTLLTSSKLDNRLETVTADHPYITDVLSSPSSIIPGISLIDHISTPDSSIEDIQLSSQHHNTTDYDDNTQVSSTLMKPSNDDLSTMSFESQDHIIGTSISPNGTTARVPSFDSHQRPPLKRLTSQKSVELTTTGRASTKKQFSDWNPQSDSAASQSVPASSQKPSHRTHSSYHYHHPQNLSSTRRPERKIMMSDILDSFKIDTSVSYDFFWVFCGRTMYYIGVSVQAFMLYFLRDVIGSSETDAQFQLGCIALLAQFCAACVAYPVGKLSDESDIGKKPLIYLACLCMSSVYLGFLISPFFGSKAFYFVLTTAALYGAGNGCFLAVDYALALATIPNKENTTQALGIWGVSAFVGSAIGPLIFGCIIESFGRDAVTQHYRYSGYVAMLFGGISATVGAGAIIKLVKGTN